MIYFVLLFSFLLIFAIFIYGIFKSQSTKFKVLSSIVAGIFIVSLITTSSLSSDIFKDASIEYIELEEVYKDTVSGTTIYYVKEKDSSNMVRVEPNNIYKGDSNQLIRCEYPRLNNVKCFLLAENKVQYNLVVKDLNIKELNSLN